MGPRHGDEFNLTRGGDKNYGWPIVSWGDHYTGIPIPDHDTRPEFMHLRYTGCRVAPSGLIIYDGSMFRRWQGNAFVGGLRSESLVRIRIGGDRAEEVERFAMGQRIREVEQGPGGAIWILEDEEGGACYGSLHTNRQRDGKQVAFNTLPREINFGINELRERCICLKKSSSPHPLQYAFSSVR